MTCDDRRFQHAAGPYLLGSLDEAERTAYDGHLATCPECRASLESLRPVVAMLATVPHDDLDQVESYAVPPPVPDTLLPGLLARAARRNRLRRLMVGALGAAAAAAAIAAVVLAVDGQESQRPEQATAVQKFVMTPRHDSPVRAIAQLKSMPWGTQITLRCHYRSEGGDAYRADGAAAYTLQIDGVQGSAHDLGSWSLGAGGDTVFTSGTALKNGQIRQIEVLGPDGSVILTTDG